MEKKKKNLLSFDVPKILFCRDYVNPIIFPLSLNAIYYSL